MGGLGNQLFQLAAGIEIFETTGKPVKFSTHFLELDGTTATTKRLLSIGDLLDPNEIIGQSFPRSAIKPFRNRYRTGSRVVIERYPSEDATLRVNSKTNYVQGYFQNWNIVDRTWKSFEKRLSSSKVFAPLLMSPAINRTAIHMRYGDYRSNVNARAFHGLTHPEYFIKALRYLEKIGASKSVLLLSDEPELALYELKECGLPKDFRVELGNSENQIQDLAAIASSSSVVASNSSFSWWGSWIAMQRSSASVILPRPWFSPGNHDVPELYLPRWHVIERRIQS